MASLAIHILDVNAVGGDNFSVSINVTWVDDQGSGRSASEDVAVSAVDSAEAINAAVRSHAIALAAGDAHGVTVGHGDVVRIFGGAVPNVS